MKRRWRGANRNERKWKIEPYQGRMEKGKSASREFCCPASRCWAVASTAPLPRRETTQLGRLGKGGEGGKAWRTTTLWGGGRRRCPSARFRQLLPLHLQERAQHLARCRACLRIRAPAGFADGHDRGRRLWRPQRAQPRLHDVPQNGVGHAHARVGCKAARCKLPEQEAKAVHVDRRAVTQPPQQLRRRELPSPHLAEGVAMAAVKVRAVAL